MKKYIYIFTYLHIYIYIMYIFAILKPTLGEMIQFDVRIYF